MLKKSLIRMGIFLAFAWVPNFGFSRGLEAAARPEVHPFAPLTAQELAQSVKALQEAKLLGQGWYLHSLVLKEPSPHQIVAKAHERRANAIVINHANNSNWKVQIEPASGRILKKERIEHGQPSAMIKEYQLVAQQLLQDPRIVNALQKRGVTELKNISVDLWGAGDLRGAQVDHSHRIFRGLFYNRGEAINPYGRPIEGLSAIFDMTENRMVELIDTGVVKIAENSADFLDAKWIFKQSQGKVREGAINAGRQTSELPFVIEGGEIHWQGFHFFPFVHPREGLVIANLGFYEEGVNRKILRRASMSEMVVPYADPDKNWHWRYAFDQGDYGIGHLSHSLFPGLHVPENAYTVDSLFADNEGNLQRIPRSLAIFERDGGLLWSHYDMSSDNMGARRGKELVVMSMFTVGNYDYGIQWILRQDGTIEVKIQLTGILAAKGVEIAKCARCKEMTKPAGIDLRGVMVAPNLLAVAHQHFFNFRLDFEIDGERNAVAEIRARKEENAAENPYGNAFYIEEEILKNEHHARRSMGAAEGQHWWIFNPNKKNRLGHFSGYVLEPLSVAGPLAQSGSKILKQATFLQYPFWVTRYNCDEMNAAGEFPSQNEGDGLGKWVARNQSIYNEDVVVWHNIGITHIPRAEDWPVMPVVQVGFLLRPKGFFEVNPALNVVDEKTKAKMAENQ